ncbi:MAG: hypothetical protein H8E41_12995 [Desulfobulbaceae bacterium]|uniref:HEPN domain-containing protein n=1 Tax=Candidatus Desulfobia pelagia TaxID=2841692 RepID=A0A8J6TD41_9BACT|nr:hypothetical protein [Candidatus Desulfobia pelagia]
MLSLQPMSENMKDPFAKPMEWQKYFREGSQFLDLATKGAKNREKFDGEALYNILAMAIEKHFMALFLYKNYMPEGHTLQDLLSAATQFVKVDMELIKGLTFMDSLQDICSVDDFIKKVPTDNEIEVMVKIAHRVKNCVEEELYR